MNISSSDINFSKRYNNYLAPEAMVLIRGDKLSEKGIYFSSIEVDKSVEGADTFRFSIADAIDLEFEPKNASLFSLGEELSIYMGYANGERKEADLTLLFVGLITSVNWDFQEDNYLDISVEGKDYSFLLMKSKYTKNISEASISSIVEKIVKENYSSSLTELKIEKTTVSYGQVRNKDLSDYLFIDALAKKVGYAFFIDKHTLYFQTKRTEKTSSFTLFYGQEILSFKPELNVEKSIAKVKVIGLVRGKDKKPIVGEASLPSIIPNSETGIKQLLKQLNFIEYEVTESVSTVEEANIRAKALLENFRLKKFTAELKSIGIPQLKAGIIITLEGLGTRFSRDYYITKAVHSFSEQGYETILTLGWSES